MLAAVQCIVIGPVCGWVAGWVCVFVCVGGSVTTISQNCMHRSDPHQTGFVGKGSDHLQLIKFWPSHTPGKGSVVGRNFCLRLTTASTDSLHLRGATAERKFWLRLTAASVQCLHLSERFFHFLCVMLCEVSK